MTAPRHTRAAPTAHGRRGAARTRATGSPCQRPPGRSRSARSGAPAPQPPRRCTARPPATSSTPGRPIMRRPRPARAFDRGGEVRAGRAVAGCPGSRRQLPSVSGPPWSLPLARGGGWRCEPGQARSPRPPWPAVRDGMAGTPGGPRAAIPRAQTPPPEVPNTPVDAPASSIRAARSPAWRSACTGRRVPAAAATPPVGVKHAGTGRLQRRRGRVRRSIGRPSHPPG